MAFEPKLRENWRTVFISERIHCEDCAEARRHEADCLCDHCMTAAQHLSDWRLEQWLSQI